MVQVIVVQPLVTTQIERHQRLKFWNSLQRGIAQGQAKWKVDTFQLIAVVQDYFDTIV